MITEKKCEISNMSSYEGKGQYETLKQYLFLLILTFWKCPDILEKKKGMSN